MGALSALWRGGPALALRALRAGAREAGRVVALSRVDAGCAYVWPVELTTAELVGFARAHGLSISGSCGGPIFVHARWRLTLDRAPDGTYAAGVATCVNDDRYRGVISLRRYLV